MNRTTVISVTVTVSLALISQGWLLYRMESLAALTQPLALATPHQTGSVATTPVHDNNRNPLGGSDSVLPIAAELQASLQRIEARLATLERQREPGTRQNVIATGSAREPSARERAAADQRLASMLPNGPLSREDIARFHADMQSLSPDERFATATALARAINEGRVQPAPGGF